MKKILLIATLAVVCAIEAAGQKIVVKSFTRNYTSLIASMNQKVDNGGTPCAVIRCFIRDTEYEVEANQGIVDRELHTGEIRLWVPQGTKRLTIRHAGVMPLRYEIPIDITAKVTYDAEIDIVEEGQQRRKARAWRGYVGAGYNVMMISGPSAILGIDVKHHQIELSGIFGTGKTDDLYFYTTSGTVKAAYSYKAMRGSLRYGYDLTLSEAIHLVPQAGVAFQQMSGTKVGTASSDNDFKGGGTVSALVGARLAIGLGKHVMLHVTPEYDFGVQKDEVSKLISKSDDTYKGWTDGISLNAGLLIRF